MGAWWVVFRRPSVPFPQEPEGVKALEARLSQGFPPEVKPLVEKALEQNRRQTEQRLKHLLPEGSEPCTIFVPRSPRGENTR